MSLSVNPYWCKLASVEDVKKPAELELSLSVVPEALAIAKPVGKGNNANPCHTGREEPNRDPWVEPVFENRTYVDWESLQQNMLELGNSLGAGFKKIAIIVVCCGVVFGLLFLVVMLS